MRIPGSSFLYQPYTTPYSSNLAPGDALLAEYPCLSAINKDVRDVQQAFLVVGSYAFDCVSVFQVVGGFQDGRTPGIVGTAHVRTSLLLIAPNNVNTGHEIKSCPGDGDPSHCRGFPSFFRYCRVEITMFSEAFMSLSDERTSTSTQLAFSGCVLLLCRFVAVRSFFEGAVLAKPSPSMIVAPPYSHVVSGCYFPILTCMRCLGPFRSLLSASRYTKKSAALLSGAYRLVQGYRPRSLQSLINVYAVYFEGSTLLFCTFFMFLCRTVHHKKKRMRYTFWFLRIFVYLGPKGSHISSVKKTKKNRKGQAGVLSTPVQNIRVLPLRNGVYIWTFER